MSELMDKARQAFDERKYATAADCFQEAAQAMPGVLEPVLYEKVCLFMSGQRQSGDLAKLWGELRDMVEEGLAQEGKAFENAVVFKTALAICTAAVYRSCNDHQMLEYANLNKDVKLEKKEYVFDEIRRVLLEADEEYKVCLDVMKEFCAMASVLPGQEQAPEAFFLAVLSYLKAAADLQNESNLDKYFPQLDLTAMACSLKIGEGMEEAIAARKELVALTLVGQGALDRWEEFAPYAAEAGIQRAAIEKKVRRRENLEKLKFWKQWLPDRKQ